MNDPAYLTGKKLCTCLGSCAGAERLGNGWVCCLTIPREQLLPKEEHSHPKRNCERCHSTGIVDAPGVSHWGSVPRMPCPQCNQKWDEFAITGYAWHEDSSLEKWFPMTAEELTKLRHIVDRQDKELAELRNRKTVKPFCGECGGEHEPSGARGECVRYWRLRALAAENRISVHKAYGTAL